jgi:hypothetical protein
MVGVTQIRQRSARGQRRSAAVEDSLTGRALEPLGTTRPFDQTGGA